MLDLQSCLCEGPSLIKAHLTIQLLVPLAWIAFPLIVDLINCQHHVKLTTQSSVKSQRPAPFAFQILFSSLHFG